VALHTTLLHATDDDLGTGQTCHPKNLSRKVGPPTIRRIGMPLPKRLDLKSLFKRLANEIK